MKSGRKLRKVKGGIVVMTVKEVTPYLRVYHPFEIVRGFPNQGGRTPASTEEAEPSGAADSESEWWTTAAVPALGN